MHYANIKHYDIADGVGVRTTLFVSGCRLHCPGCFNAVAWDFNYGKIFDDEVATKIIESTQSENITGITLLGGEPTEPENQEALIPFLKRFRKEAPDKDVWMFSGRLWEELIKTSKELLSLVDVLVDGPYIADLHDPLLRFRGSENQRIIDVPKSLEAGKVVEWSDSPVLATRGKMFPDD